jgi:polyhydroxyalkanoate synthesis regulator phasin
MPPSIQELISNVVAQITHEHEQEKSQLKLQITDAYQTEIDRLKTKIQSMAQNEDNYKFQKRTVASLTSEIATLTQTVAKLEARLKQANQEIRLLKQPNFRPPTKEEEAPKEEPLVPDVAQPAKEEPLVPDVAQPAKEEPLVPDVAQPAKEEPLVPDVAQPTKEEPATPANAEADPQIPEVLTPEIPQPEADLVPVVLKSGTYYWDPDSHELYDYVSEDLIGSSVGFMKTVKIRNRSYYMDVRDDTFYESSPDTIGAYAGQIVNRKAIFAK